MEAAGFFETLIATYKPILTTLPHGAESFFRS